jgi:hypothetical protein
MGNRAVIQIVGCQAGLYLHWNGGEASVLGFLQAARELGLAGSDPQYLTARLAQIIGNWFGGCLSLGVDHVDRLDCDNHDNGVYLIDVRTLEISRRRYVRDGQEVNPEKTATIAAEAVAASRAFFEKSD